MHHFIKAKGRRENFLLLQTLDNVTRVKVQKKSDACFGQDHVSRKMQGKNVSYKVWTMVLEWKYIKNDIVACVGQDVSKRP